MGSIGIDIQVGSCHESPWIYCNFFAKPKINLTIQRPKILPDGYPIRPKTLGERIKKKRMDMGLFQKDIARIIGVSTDTVTNWEKGRTKPCRKTLVKLMDVMKVEESKKHIE
ncbi:MAG: helix-turn-helix domain-containing protein [Candidatus Hermodarchaeota archaeon]